MWQNYSDTTHGTGVKCMAQIAEDVLRVLSTVEIEGNNAKITAVIT